MQAEGCEHPAPFAVRLSVPLSITGIASVLTGFICNIILCALCISDLSLCDRKNVFGIFPCQFYGLECSFPLFLCFRILCCLICFCIFCILCRFLRFRCTGIDCCFCVLLRRIRFSVFCLTAGILCFRTVCCLGAICCFSSFHCFNFF